MNHENFQSLKTLLRGNLLLPGENGYEDARRVWNGMIDRRPAAIARCLGVADIAAGVKFARENSLPISIKGGGHNIAGLAVCDDGLMLDMSLMRGVFVDTDRQIAHAQPGCLLGDVDRETQQHGLAAVLGFVSNTGIAGLTLGGGFGYLTRKFGWTSDNVVSMNLIGANGAAVRASEKENSDLFWALRGGGGNFGVVTNFEYKLHTFGPEIMGGVVAWPGEEAPEVLHMFYEFTKDAPPDIACAAILRIAPPAPWLPREIHGKPIVAIFVCCYGAAEEREPQVARLKKFRRPAGDILQRRTYVSQQSLIDATQPKGLRYYWKSEYLPALNPDLFSKAIEHAGHFASPNSAIIFFQISGALNELPDDHSAVGNRNANWVLNITGSWEKQQEDDPNIDWVRSCWRDLRRFSTGGTYINFLTEEEGADRTLAAYGNNYQRLLQVKKKWDPENVFRINKNIAP